MSISKPENKRPANPCKRFYRWSGEKGKFSYWDKEAGGKDEEGKPIGANVEVDNICLVVIDILVTVNGFNEPNQAYLIANEISKTRMKDDPLTVCYYKKDGTGKRVRVEVARGVYSDIKSDVVSFGGSYNESVYGIDCKTGELVNVTLGGSAFGKEGNSSWFEISNRACGMEISVIGTIDQKKGRVEFKSPIWSCEEPDHELFEKALAFDRDVFQPYLDSYFKFTLGGGSEEKNEHLADDDGPGIDERDENEGIPTSEMEEEEVF